MTKDLIRYDLHVQAALKGVVRRVLADVAKDGLPGDHHFYISFKTGAPGVRLSQRLRDSYPDEMTIILQHQFWDLGVTEHAFEVGLSFQRVPERLLVPFDAITGFSDPSVQFGLKFEVGEPGDGPAALPAPAPAPVALASVPAERTDATRGSVPAIAPAAKDRDKAKEPRGRGAAKAPEPQPETAADGSATVVSLDAFRKK